MVTVRFIYVSSDFLKDEKIFDKCLSDVREQKREKIRVIKNEKASRESLAGELLLMFALKKTKTDYEKCEFSFKGQGKPYIKNYKDFSYNISHSDGLVAFAYSKKEVGCDIEKIRETDVDKLKRILSEDEIETLDEITDKREKQKVFFKFWTKKESLAKLNGESVFRFNGKGNVKTFMIKKDYAVTVSANVGFLLVKKQITPNDLLKELDINIENK